MVVKLAVTHLTLEEITQFNQYKDKMIAHLPMYLLKIPQKNIEQDKVLAISA